MQESNQNGYNHNDDRQGQQGASNNGNDSYQYQYQYRQSGSYTTSDGRSGYSYTPNRAQGEVPPVRKQEKKSGARTFVMVLCIVLVALILLGTACYMGISMVTRFYNEANNDKPTQKQEQTSDAGNVPESPNKTFPNHVVVQKADSIKGGEIKEVTSAGNSNYSLAKVVALVQDSVVEISTEKVVNSSWYGQYVLSGAGSGVIISASDGCVIITNYHVISDASTITVKLTDGTEYEASVRGYDAVSDLAVLYCATGDKELTYAEMGCSADLVVGEDVIAIGNPLGSLGGTVTNGIISATARKIYIDGIGMTLLQTNAAISPGNSGGGLFNMAGQLIGIVNAKSSDSDAEGLGFAIPIDHAWEIVQELIEYGTILPRVDSGLELVDKTDSTSAYYTFGNTSTGVYVMESAFCEELQRGDRIVSVDGSSVSSSDVLDSILRQKEPGDIVTIVVERRFSQGRYATLKQVEVQLTLREPTE